MNGPRLSRQPTARIVFWLYALAWTALLLVPHPEKLLFFRDVLPDAIVSGKGHWDKLVHGSGYLGLFVLGSLAYVAGASGLLRHWVFPACVAHAALTEIGQLAVPSRTADVLDWLADVTGICVGICLMLGFCRRRIDVSSAQGAEKRPLNPPSDGGIASPRPRGD